MTIPDTKKIYPRAGDSQTIYLKNVIDCPNIEVGDFTIYNDFVHDPRDFQKYSVLYHYPINHDKVYIGKILFYRVRSKIFDELCESYAVFSVRLYVSTVR